MPVRAEFTVEPFEEGNPGPHVQAAIDALSAHDPEIGPFGTAIEGSLENVFDAAGTCVRSAIDTGASRVTVNMTVTP